MYGKDAEGLVRYRYGYAEGDVGRIKTQQIFLKAFAKKVMSPAVMNNLPKIVTSLFNYVKTDVSLTEILFTYLPLLSEFDLNNLEFHTLPGEGADYEGPSYFYIDQDELNTLIKDVFYDTTIADATKEDEAQQVVIDQEVSIEVYNAAGVKGLAGTLKDTLKKRGYNVARIDNYTDTDVEESIIYAKDKTKANQFLEYLEGATIIEDRSLESDIKIVIGKNSANALQ